MSDVRRGPHASARSSIAVVVMAKRPVAGRAKTRLCEELSGAEAAALYAEMLADRCAQVARLADVVPAITYANDRDGGATDAPKGFQVIEQPPGDLGVGLSTAAEHFLARGLPVLLVDSDSVTLPIAHLETALEHLRAHQGGSPARPTDVVVGPCEDGGYYLLGLRQFFPQLFVDIPWSSARVAEMTIRRAQSLGLSVAVLPTWWDVDTPSDLRRLSRELTQTWWPTRTAAWLRTKEIARLNSAERPGANVSPTLPTRFVRESSRSVYGTPWFSVREDLVRLPDGRRTHYSVVDCAECVGVLPFLDEHTVLLVRQYRYASDRVTWEMPTGGIHAGESVERAAARELVEEARVGASEMEYLGSYHTSKSVMNETAHLFVARGLIRAKDAPASGSAAPDDSEFLRVQEFPFAKVLDMVLSGEIVDSMTIVAVLRAALRAGGRPEGQKGIPDE